MRGRQFLELAREILKGGSERHRRGAAGRAYYALMLECRDALDAWGFTAPRRDAVHGFVRQRFDSTANADLRAIHAALEALGKLRNEADYDLRAVFVSTSFVQQAIDKAAVQGSLSDWKTSMPPPPVAVPPSPTLGRAGHELCRPSTHFGNLDDLDADFRCGVWVAWDEVGF